MRKQLWKIKKCSHFSQTRKKTGFKRFEKKFKETIRKKNGLTENVENIKMIS